MLTSYEGKFDCVLLFGPPGSGKGTVGKSLAQAGGHFHLSSGDIFRGLSSETKLGKLVADFSSKGLLVPDDVTLEVWHHYVMGMIETNRYFPEEQLLLSDGLPRTVQQAELLDAFATVKGVIVLDVEDRDLLIQRLKARAVKQKRMDDADEAVLKRRLEVYDAQTAALLKHYPKELLVRIRADQRPLEVLRDILNEMSGLLSEKFHLSA
jgi:adenylate kinase